MSHGPAPSHELIDHTSEIQLRVRAGSFADLLAESGRAVAELQLPRGHSAPAAGRRQLRLTAPDRERLLVDWLNELIFLAETDRWVATEFQIDRADGTSVVATVRGVEVPQVRGLVKAATMHALHVREVNSMIEAEVILDI
ncbi:MAG TPA: archease [Gemmatimonadales bacterium]|nr:archease [Gemmatimonadales bacterium]